MTRDNREDAEPGETVPAGRSPMMLIGIVAVCLLAGGAGGWLVLGPKMLGAYGAASQEGGAPDGSAGSKKKGSPAVPAMHQLENLVVNPAETQGTRFLVATIAMETDGMAAVDELERRDVKVRDTLLRVLGSRTVGELSDLEGREQLKVEIASSLSALLVTGRVTQVYFPQFVIQ